MCGIVAVAGKIGVNEESAFRQLLILDSLRGEHSTGVVSVNALGEVETAKRVGDPFQLFDTSQWRDIMNRQNRILIGHNRYATVGKINRANAHPFEFSNIVGVHNGTLTNKHSLPNSHRFDTDTETLYSYINDVGVKEAISHTDGAWALAFFDRRERGFSILRNKERPLSFAVTEDGNTIFVASEAWMLTAILGRKGIKYREITELPVNTLMTFDVNLGQRVWPVGDPIKPRVKTVEGKPPYSFRTTPFQQTAKTISDTSPVGEKDARLLMRGTTKDSLTGGRYIICHSEVFPSHDIRLYFHENNWFLDHVGEEITGDITTRVKNQHGHEYFKVTPMSVNLYIESVEEETKEGDCDWCGSPVLSSEKYFKNKDHIICSTCRKDKDVISYLPQAA